MVNVKEISRILADLTALKRFPIEPSARAAITRMACEMADPTNRIPPDQQIRWLVNRMVTLYNEWPGPKEMRAVFCSRFKPHDGIEALPDMQQFPDGIPADPALPPLVPAPDLKQIASGETVTADPELAPTFEKLMSKTALPKSRLSQREREREASFNRTLEAMLTPPHERKEIPVPTPQAITQADVDALVAKRRR